MSENDPLLNKRRHNDQAGAFERQRLLHPEDVEPGSLTGGATLPDGASTTATPTTRTDGGGSIGRRTTQARPRVLTFDLARGLLCIFMAIDHSLFFSGKEHPMESWNIHPDRHRPYLDSWYHYGLRFVSHLCAPGFSMLMGLGCVYFVRARADGVRWGAATLARHILTRAVVFTIVGWSTIVPMKLLMPQMQQWFTFDIIEALAVGFAVAGLLTVVLHNVDKRAPAAYYPLTALVAALAVGGVALTCALVPEDRTATPPAWARILWLGGDWKLIGSRFPPLAWLPHVLYGVAYGRLSMRLGTSATRQAALSLVLGVAMLLVFLAVRLPAGFGNITPVAAAWYRRGAKEFLWTAKYPPDGAYSALFLGLNHLLIALFAVLPYPFPGFSLGVGGSSSSTNKTDAQQQNGSANTSGAHSGSGSRWRLNTSAVLLAFGSSAFFFYFVHVYTFILASVAFSYAGLMTDPDKLGDGYVRAGVGNGALYWVVLTALLLPVWLACRWYAGFKQSKSADSVWRYF